MAPKTTMQFRRQQGWVFLAARGCDYDAMRHGDDHSLVNRTGSRIRLPSGQLCQVEPQRRGVIESDDLTEMSVYELTPVSWSIRRGQWLYLVIRYTETLGLTPIGVYMSTAPHGTSFLELIGLAYVAGAFEYDPVA